MDATPSCKSTGWAAVTAPERLVHYQMKPEMGPPETKIHEFSRGGDDSWRLEMEDFEKDIALGRKPSPGLEDAPGRAQDRGSGL